MFPFRVLFPFLSLGFFSFFRGAVAWFLTTPRRPVVCVHLCSKEATSVYLFSITTQQGRVALMSYHTQGSGHGWPVPAPSDSTKTSLPTQPSFRLFCRHFCQVKYTCWGPSSWIDFADCSLHMDTSIHLSSVPVRGSFVVPVFSF